MLSDKHRVYELNIELHPAQQAIDACKSRFKVVKAGRRFGKTKYSLKYLLDGVEKPNSKNWLIAPTGIQAKRLVWYELLSLLPYSLIKRKNVAEMNIWLTNGAEIGLRGSDNDKTLRGSGLDRVVMEEAAYQKAYIWNDIVRPQLSDRRGMGLFISSPKPGSWFNVLYDKYKDNMSDEWKTFHYTIYDNPYISRNEIELIKNSPEMNQITWKREYMAEDIAEAGGLVYGGDFARKTHIYVADGLDLRKLRCVQGVDWGLSDYTAGCWLHVLADKTLAYDLDYSKNNTSATKAAMEMLEVGACRNITDRVLDATAFKREGSGPGVAQEFYAAGLKCNPAEKNIDVGINIVKSFLQGKEGKPGIRFNSKCREVVNDIESWEYGKHEPDRLAALRYALVYIYRRRITDYLDGMEKIDSLTNTQEAVTINRKRRPLAELTWDYNDGCFC